MDAPETAALLDIARATLADEVAPALSGDARFKARMIANALSIAARALRAEPGPTPPDPHALVAAIRAGAHDGDAALRATLLAEATARCRVSAPKAI